MKTKDLLFFGTLFLSLLACQSVTAETNNSMHLMQYEATQEPTGTVSSGANSYDGKLTAHVGFTGDFAPSQGNKVTLTLSTDQNINNTGAIFYQTEASSDNTLMEFFPNEIIHNEGGKFYLHIASALYDKVQSVQYAPINYGITYYLNDGGNSIISSRQIPFGSIPSDLIPTRTGYQFNGWYLDSQGTLPYLSVVITKNLKLYARWEWISVIPSDPATNMPTVDPIIPSDPAINMPTVDPVTPTDSGTNESTSNSNITPSNSDTQTNAKSTNTSVPNEEQMLEESSLRVNNKTVEQSVPNIQQKATQLPKAGEENAKGGTLTGLLFVILGGGLLYYKKIQ